MVVIHEFGHYLAGKIFKFKINEFAIGFGPPIFKHTSKKTGEVFSIRPLPLGGFCQFQDEDADSKVEGAFNSKPAWQRLIVLFSGAFFNFVAALIIITFFFTLYGQPLPTIYKVYGDSPNAELLQQDDAIIKINGRNVNVLEEGDYNKILANAGEEVSATILRNGKTIKLTLHKANIASGKFDENGEFIPEIGVDGSPITFYGFGISTYVAPHKIPFLLSIGRAFSFMFFLVYKILALFGSLFTGKIGMENVGGPIATVNAMQSAARGGAAMLIYVVSLISANLAVMNLLPLPALDGSRMLFCVIEMIFKKPINKKVEGIIHAAGFILLIGFALFADVFRLIKLNI
jgi:regulator of sigma E protease